MIYCSVRHHLACMAARPVNGPYMLTCSGNDIKHNNSIGQSVCLHMQNSQARIAKLRCALPRLETSIKFAPAVVNSSGCMTSSASAMSEDFSRVE